MFARGLRYILNKLETTHESTPAPVSWVHLGWDLSRSWSVDSAAEGFQCSVFLGGCCILCPEMSSNVEEGKFTTRYLDDFSRNKKQLDGWFLRPEMPEIAWSSLRHLRGNGQALELLWHKEVFCFPVLPLNILNMSEFIYCTSSYLYLPLLSNVILCSSRKHGEIKHG